MRVWSLPLSPHTHARTHGRTRARTQADASHVAACVASTELSRVPESSKRTVATRATLCPSMLVSGLQGRPCTSSRSWTQQHRTCTPTPRLATRPRECTRCSVLIWTNRHGVAPPCADASTCPCSACLACAPLSLGCPHAVKSPCPGSCCRPLSPPTPATAPSAPSLSSSAP